MLILSCWTVIAVCFSGVRTTYLPINDTQHAPPSRRPYHKSNSINQLKSSSQSAFRDDADISHYLKVYGVELMIWRCKNAIQPLWNWKPVPFVDLYCEVIGTMQSIMWSRKKKELVSTTGGWITAKKDTKYSHTILPHFVESTGYFSRWIDFRLRIHHPKRRDAGVYTFSATSPRGYTQEQTIYVEVPDRPRHSRKIRRRRRRRRDKKKLGTTDDSSVASAHT